MLYLQRDQLFFSLAFDNVYTFKVISNCVVCIIKFICLYAFIAVIAFLLSLVKKETEQIPWYYINTFAYMNIITLTFKKKEISFNSCVYIHILYGRII